MGKAKATFCEILQITKKLIELGLCDSQNFPILRDVGPSAQEVTFKTSSNFSFVLRNLAYREIYEAVKAARDYNIALPDGGLMQLQYDFVDDEIVRHRLAFLPSPDLTEYQNDPEVYELDVIYAEILDKCIIPTPMRFDFDKESYEENNHPMSHLTIGHYKNCRIPVRCAVSPYRFFEFILCSFYNTAHRNFGQQIEGLDIVHPMTISKIEAKRVHLSLDININ